MPYRRLGAPFRGLGRHLGAPRGGAAPYAAKIIALFGSSLIAYWVMNETTGTAVKDSGPLALTDGAYVGTVSLANTVSQPGTPCPLFDGSTGYANVQSAALAAAFNGAEGSISLWEKLNSFATYRYLLYCYVDASNYVLIQDFAALGSYQLVYRANATSKTKQIVGVASGWHNHVFTWSASADKVRHYVDGVENGAALTGLGVWAGSLTVARLVGSTGGTYRNAWQAHNYFLNRAMTPAEVLQQYNAGL